jgi:hypothetical protein
MASPIQALVSVGDFGELYGVPVPPELRNVDPDVLKVDFTPQLLLMIAWFSCVGCRCLPRKGGFGGYREGEVCLELKLLPLFNGLLILSRNSMFAFVFC